MSARPLVKSNFCPIYRLQTARPPRPLPRLRPKHLAARAPALGMTLRFADDSTIESVNA
jgi:hypothetical protein